MNMIPLFLPVGRSKMAIIGFCLVALVDWKSSEKKQKRQNFSHRHPNFPLSLSNKMTSLLFLAFDFCIFPCSCVMIFDIFHFINPLFPHNPKRFTHHGGRHRHSTPGRRQEERGPAHGDRPAVVVGRRGAGRAAAPACAQRATTPCTEEGKTYARSRPQQGNRRRRQEGHPRTDGPHAPHPDGAAPSQLQEAQRRSHVPRKG